jgi:hypothetical protein
VHRGRRPLKELGKKIYKSGGDHYNKTKKGIEQKKEKPCFGKSVAGSPQQYTLLFLSFTQKDQHNQH